jgi:OmpA-OmpF porin, OOP family
MEKDCPYRILTMNKLVAISLFFTILFSDTMGQSLIKNPGFELYEICPKEYTAIHEAFRIPGWYSPSTATPDYFNACSRGSVGVPVNFMGHQWAREGNGYVGIILAEEPDLAKDKKKAVDEREYVTTELDSNLLRDSLYIIGFSYSIAPNSTYSVNRLGICLTGSKPKCRKVLGCEPCVSMDTTVTDSTTGVWFRVLDTIRASGQEKFLTVGNFYPDRQTRYYKLDISTYRKSLREAININKLAYYFIDCVELKPVRTSDGMHKKTVE